MDEQTVPIVEGNKDITLKEAHPIKVEESFITSPSEQMLLANKLSMPDSVRVSLVAGRETPVAIPVTINENLETEVQLDTITWSTSANSSTNLAVQTYPQFYFAQMSDTFVTRLLGNYSYVRWDAITFKIKTNLTKFHQGYVRVFAIPMRTRILDGTSPNAVHNNNSILLPGGDIYANQSNSIEFDVPWMQTHPYIPLSAGEFVDFLHTVFSLQFRVIVPLSSSSTNEDNGNIAIFASFKKPSVQVRQHVKDLPTGTYYYEEAGERKVRAQSALEGAITGGLETAMAVESGNVVGAITSGLKTVNSIATLVSNLDKPIYQETSQVKVRSTASIAHGSGISMAHKLGLTPSDTHLTPKPIQSDMRELDMCHLAQQYGIGSIVSWSQSQAKGTILTSIALNGLYSFGNIADGAPDLWSPIPLTFVATRFRLMKGGIKIRLKVVSSSIHTGRLVMFFIPRAVATTDIEATTKNATTYKNLVMDFNETNHIFEWTVPFYYSEPWFNMNTTYDKVNLYSEKTPYFSRGVNYGWGTVALMVQSELVTTSQISSSVSIVVEIAGAPDIMFAQPNRGFPYETAVPEVAVKAQMMSASKTGFTEVAPLKNIFHGDEIETSVVPLCRRYGALSLRRWNTRDFSELKWVNHPLLDIWWDEAEAGVAGIIRAPQTNLSYFAYAYAFWSGPLRYMIVSTTTRTQKLIATFRYDARIEDYGLPALNFTPVQTLASGKPPFDRFNLPTDIMTGAAQTVMEEEVPFMSNTYMKVIIDAPTMPDFNPAIANNPQLCGFMTYNQLLEVDGPDTATEKFSFYVLQSAGDSFLFHHFLGAPIIALPHGTLQV